MQLKTRASEWLTQLITDSGGCVESERYVTRAGCAILSCSRMTEDAAALYENFNIDLSRPDYEQRAEFSSRLTYMSFREETVSARDYNEKMAREFQHLSVHGSTTVQFLLAGIAVETSMELIAHGEASVGRLTSSKTKAMDETLYRLIGSDEERAVQRAFIEDFIKLRESLPTDYTREFRNMLNLPLKATALTYTMSLKDFHKLFIGRLSPSGNETEVQEICRRMCELLHAEYPLVIRAPDDYYALNNGEKYKAN